MTDSRASLPDDVSPAAELYVWGFPLVSVQRTKKLFCSRSDTGRLNHVDDLATPADKGIVAPNNDTLYSSGWYDLSHGDLQIDVPAMDHPGRYWNVMILDAYTHVTYVCRRHHGVNGTSVTIKYDPSTPPANDTSRVVTVATPTAWVIIRVLVETPGDIEQARLLQRAIKVTAEPEQSNERLERGGRPTDIAKTGVDYFSELKGYVEQDPPAQWHPQLSNAAQEILINPSAVDETTLLAGIKEGDRLMSSPKIRGTVVQNGWSTGRDATGFGGDMLKRAVGAKFGLGGHQAIENRSYIAMMDADGEKLDGSKPLTLYLDANNMPPCNGFWSLTAYTMELYLVENDIDRWSLGDRTPGLNYDEDGSLTIILSYAKPHETANWLPVPNGSYMLGMRVYEGHDAVVNCEWFPPQLC